MKKKIAIKSTYPIWGLWFAFLLGCTCAAFYLFGGCEYHEYPVAPDRTMIEVNKTTPFPFDSSIYYIASIQPIDSTSATFYLRSGYGSEIRTNVWRDGDSLLCDMTGFKWYKLLKCVWRGMEVCDYHDGVDAYWVCVAFYATGCGAGFTYAYFITMPLGWL